MTTPANDVLLLTLPEVLEATGAKLVAGRPAFSGSPLRGVSTDTRAITAGSLFIGLPGERFDGSDFGAQALVAGAGAVLVSEAKVGATLASAPAEGGVLLSHPSPMRALGLLARWHRRRMQAQVIAITGSNGKTTTKEMLRHALSAHDATLATEGNLNNEVGAPLTLLRLRSNHRYAAIEVGMNHEGEIGRLTAISEPDVGVVTCAAAVHVEALGSVEAVSRAKGELFTGLGLDGLVVANADDPLVAERARWAGRRTLWFGRSENADVRLESIVSHDAAGLRIMMRHGAHLHDLTLPVVGEHNAMNACAAFAAAIGVGVPADRILAGLSVARPPGRRLRLGAIPGTGATLLDDCYNANPHSTIAALQTLRGLAPAGSRIAVLGDMRELGADEEHGHRSVGAEAASSGLKLLVAFGPASRQLADEARKQGIPAGSVISTDDPAEAAAAVRARLSPGDLVLVKASRGTRLERVSDLLVPPADAEGAH